MARRQKKARRSFDRRISFNELCRKVGINTKQRIIMRRYLIERYKKKEGGGNL